jgi:hypothetical protein
MRRLLDAPGRSEGRAGALSRAPPRSIAQPAIAIVVSIQSGTLREILVPGVAASG